MQWISVKERLPEVHCTVLLYQGGLIRFGYLCTNGMYWEIGYNWLEGVTHWMPLPDPPEFPKEE